MNHNLESLEAQQDHSTEQDDTFGFADVWNGSLLEREDRPVVARNRLWASELGKAPIDVVLKMRGEVPTNPPNARSLRKFEAGNIWEWIVKLILVRAGILLEEQTWLAHQYPDLLEVSGKLDFLAGGKPDYQKGRESLKELMLPDVFIRAGENIMNFFEKNYPNGLETKVLEIKSVSSFIFDSLEPNKRATKIHRMQCYHYLKAKNIQRGEIVYICRDDCRMMAVPVILGGPDEESYKGAIETLTKWYNSKELPPLEKPVVWDEDMQKFSKNFNVAYSMYLTKLYGFKDQAEFDDKFGPVAERWNRVIGRLRDGKEMTENNQEALAEMEEAGFDIELIKKQIIKTK